MDEGWLFEILAPTAASATGGGGVTTATATLTTSDSSSSSSGNGEVISTMSRVSSFVNNEAIPTTTLLSSASESNLNLTMYNAPFDSLTAPSAAIGRSARRFRIGKYLLGIDYLFSY